MTRAIIVVAVMLGLGLATVLLGASRVPAAARADRCTDAGTRPKPCVGPVVDESGGGGDALTIVLSVVIGLAVAGVAFVLLRRQLSPGERTRRGADPTHVSGPGSEAP